MDYHSLSILSKMTKISTSGDERFGLVEVGLLVGEDNETYNISVDSDISLWPGIIVK